MSNPAHTPVAFIGLGVMGYPMAGHLAASGYPVRVYNRNPARANAWQHQFANVGPATTSVAATPSEAAKGAKVVLACVGNDEDVRAVTLGRNGAFTNLAAGAVFVDHTTASAGVARELAAAAAARDAAFVDAPVSGGQAGAESGQLTVMAGGDPAHFAQVEALLSVYARRVRLMGPAGAGQLTKMVNQICIAGVLQGLAEGVQFAQAAGLDGAAVLDVISQGAAQSWQMDNRGSTMLQGEFDFGFAVDWMRKDLGIALAEARQNGARLPLTALVDQFYADVQAAGGGRLDTSSLLTRF